MRLSRLAALGLVASLGACAAATPGYTPSTPKLEKYKATVAKGGGFEADGSYTLTEQERDLDCKRLTGSVTLKIIQMRHASDRSKPSALAAAAQSTARPLVGGTTYGQSIEADLKRDRARLEALNAQLAAKKCPVFDLDAELKPGNVNPPRVVKPAGAKK